MQVKSYFSNLENIEFNYNYLRHEIISINLINNYNIFNDISINITLNYYWT